MRSAAPTPIPCIMRMQRTKLVISRTGSSLSCVSPIFETGVDFYPPRRATIPSVSSITSNVKQTRPHGCRHLVATRQSYFTTEPRGYLKRSMRAKKFVFWHPKHTAVRAPRVSKNLAARGSTKESTPLKWMTFCVFYETEPNTML